MYRVVIIKLLYNIICRYDHMKYVNVSNFLIIKKLNRLLQENDFA